MEAKKIVTENVYTKEEYFELLSNSLHKYEYLDGRVRMMAGGTAAHGDIVGNIYFEMRRGSHDCKINNSEIAVAVAKANKYFFPDASALCAPPEYEPGALSKLTNPSLIVEVLSEGTAEYDRSSKFTDYRKLESFREYILIDSRQYSIESYYRESNDLWRIGSYYKLDQSLPVYTLGVDIPLRDIYAGVPLEEMSFDPPK